MIKVSVIATIYNAENIVELLVNEISTELESTQFDYEIILVEDGGFDNSWKLIKEISLINSKIIGIKLSRNFGQQIAMSSGIRYAKGDIVIIMDGDLQNPPSAIPSLIKKIEEGNDIVYTTAYQRNSWFDSFTSKTFWWLMTKIFKLKIVQHQLMMKAMTSNYVKYYNSYQETNRIVAGITHDIGMKSAVLEVENRKRHSGRSNYNFLKRFHLMVDIIISMSNYPLNFTINISVISIIITVFLGIYQLVHYLNNDDVPAGYTTIMLSLFFIGSVIILLLGIIGRYLSNIYVEVKNRPLFHVQETTNVDSSFDY